MSEQDDRYVPPVLRDYGSLVEITRGVDFSGVEDGGSKLTDVHHSGLLIP